MAMRRQRVKATANLMLVKRKVKTEDSSTELLSPTEPEPLPAPKHEIVEDDATEVAFKMPAASSVGQMDDVFHSDLEDNVIQMDLQKTTNGYPMSPSKVQARQRLRPTPVFGQRRNSFVGSPLAPDYDTEYQSPGTPTRRERYLSGSSMGGGGTPQQIQASPKYFGNVMSPGMGRIRTESSCSVFSDSGGGKQRKGEGDKTQSQSHQRINAKRDFETRFNNGVPDKSTFKMFDMIYYNPVGLPMEQKRSMTTIKSESNGSISGHSDDAKPTQSELMEAKVDLSSPAAAMPVPQLKLDANGEMIIDEKTLEIETTAEVEARKVLANSSLILMDETTGDNGFYKRHKRTPVWSAEDTVRFYRSLQTIGTDFSLMCEMFPKRTRRDLKLKYKREERVNGQLINKALLYPKAFNIQELKDQLQREDLEREEADRKWHQTVVMKSGQKKRSGSRADRALTDGDLVYENEHVNRKKLSKHALAKRRTELNAENETGEAPKRRRRRVKEQQPGQPAQGHYEEKQRLQQLEVNDPTLTNIKSERGFNANEQMINYKESGERLQEELNSLLEDGNDEKCNLQNNNVVINMDDGTLNYVSSVDLTTNTGHGDAVSLAGTSFTVEFIDDTPPESADDINEHDIEQILNELAEGSMVLVSSLDPEQEDRVVNEIYMYDKHTGDLCEQPLQIPEHIVQSILNVMS